MKALNASAVVAKPPGTETPRSASWPIISPSEEFLPPTWARSDRRRSRSQRTLLKAGTPGGFRYFSNLNPKESHRDGRPAPGVLCLRRHRHHRRDHRPQPADPVRSEEHTSELQSLMRISYAVFCLKKN